jgi:hypothetical protein
LHFRKDLPNHFLIFYLNLCNNYKDCILERICQIFFGGFFYLNLCNNYKDCILERICQIFFGGFTDCNFRKDLPNLFRRLYELHFRKDLPNRFLIFYLSLCNNYKDCILLNEQNFSLTIITTRIVYNKEFYSHRQKSSPQSAFFNTIMTTQSPLNSDLISCIKLQFLKICSLRFFYKINPFL